MSRITQATIARIHGVSRQAVGCALGLYSNTNIKLKPETKAKIVKTAQELGYRPNRMAQLISGRRSGMIGVMSFGGVGQMSAQSARAIAGAIQEAGYQPMVYDVTWYREGGMETVVSFLLDHRVEGIVMITPTQWMLEETLELLRRSEVPLVALDGVRLKGVPQVESNYEGDTFRLVDGLLDAGYRSLLFLSNWDTKRRDGGQSTPRASRIHGFVRAIEERGGKVSEGPRLGAGDELFGEIYYTPMDVNWDDPYAIGELGMQQILARREWPEVVVCANDDWAAGALKACGSHGVSVPGQMGVTGNDGTLISGYGPVPLTTIVKALPTMAHRVIELLGRLIEGENLTEEDRHLEIPGEIVWRASSRKPDGPVQ